MYHGFTSRVLKTKRNSSDGHQEGEMVPSDNGAANSKVLLQSERRVLTFWRAKGK